MSSRGSALVVVVGLVVGSLAACGPLPGYQACHDRTDCLDGQLCIVENGTSRCADVAGAEGEGDGAEGEGAEGEGGGAEGEGEGGEGTVVVDGPAFAPVGVSFAMRFTNGTGADDDGCIAVVDDGIAVPAKSVQIDAAGAHTVVVRCASTSSSATSIEAWDVSDFQLSSPSGEAPASATLSWTVAGGVAVDDVGCAVHTHATSGAAAPADPDDTVITAGGTVPLPESSFVSITSCAHVDEPALLARGRDLAVVEVQPATPSLSLEVTAEGAGPALVAHAVTAGAESCGFVSVDGGFGIGTGATRTSPGQTVFAARLSASDIGAGAASSFVVVCRNGASSSDPSAAVVVHGADVVDDAAALAGVNVQLGSIHAGDATAALDLPSLTHVAGDVAVVTTSAAPASLRLPALEQVTGALTVDGSTLSTFDLVLGSDDVVTPGPPLTLGALHITGDALSALAIPRLVAVGGDLEIRANPQLADVELPSLTSVGGTFVLEAAEDCAALTAVFCALTTPRDAAPAVDGSGIDCAPVCP